MLLKSMGEGRTVIVSEVDTRRVPADAVLMDVLQSKSNLMRAATPQKIMVSLTQYTFVIINYMRT